jgi:hypothetical protein
MTLFKAVYKGEVGIYKHQEYIINIGNLVNCICVKRKCGAGKVFYKDINEFLANWDNIRIA